MINFISFIAYCEALGNNGMGISVYAIILLSIALLFFPAQQGYGFFTLSPELNDKELIELNKLKQLVLAEQTRDEIFDLSEQKNPYLDIASIVPEYFETNEVKSINSLDRANENFQLVKDEQISIAEKKCNKILGGKIISNPLFNEPVIKESVHEFTTDIQSGHMDRGSDEFKDYRLLQISMAEEFRDDYWENSLSQMQFSNPYLNYEPISIDSSIEEQKLPYRQSEELKNAIIEQIAFAETYRNNLLDYRSAGNPYLEEKLDENIDESLDMSNRNIIFTDGTEPTFVSEELGINVIGRESKGFEMIQALEIEIAQNTLNEMRLLPNSEVGVLLPNSEEMDNEIISLTDENKKLNDVERGDQGFEFFKNKQIDAAEKKLMEILGYKNIQNFEN
jgi:hypothetical protein